MTPAQRTSALAILWEAMVERGERLHDDIVLGQRKGTAPMARRLAARAQEIASLAHAASVLANKATE